jgi:transcriptional regulator with XRE-family HTH domain
MTLAKRVRDYRYAKGWGPDELAHRAEISRTALYQIESGKTELPRAGTLRRIAKALDVSVDVLLGHMEPAHAALPMGTSPLVSGGTERPTDWSLVEERSLGYSPATGSYANTDPGSVAARESSQHFGYWPMMSRERDLTRKLHELLASPLGEGVARIVEESHRMLPQWHAKSMG